MGFSSLRQHYDNHMFIDLNCAQVSDVAHGPLVYKYNLLYHL